MDTQTTTKEEKEILEIFNSLPEIIKNAITKSSWEVILRGIVSKYRLRVDMGTKLENMTFALMMGVMEPREFFDSIHNEFELDKETADALFLDVDQKIFARIEEMTRKLETEVETNRQTFVKDERAMSTQDDEILTLTRDEILKDIEDPTEAKTEDTLPDLKDSSVMPKANDKVEPPKPVVPVIPSIPVPQNPAKAVEIREEQIPSNLPTENVIPIKKEEPKIDNTKPLNPVDIGLKNIVSASNKPYQATDPYRESLE